MGKGNAKWKKRRANQNCKMLSLAVFEPNDCFSGRPFWQLDEKKEKEKGKKRKGQKKGKKKEGKKIKSI